jgi:hypothetical protein
LPLTDDRRTSGRARPTRRRKPPRSREELERERAELRQKTDHELDAIAAEYHARLPRAEAECLGAIYARYSTRHQDSIADQVRSIFEDVVRLKIFVPREMIFGSSRFYERRLWVSLSDEFEP